MPAFTHLCKKINISLAHNTLTLYPKKTAVLGTKQCLHTLKSEYVDHNNEIQSINTTEFDVLGPHHFVSRDDPNHELYHDDTFNQADLHYHLNFTRVLDERSLDKILSIFIRYNLVSTDEKERFLTAYKQANPIDPNDFIIIDSIAASSRSKAENKIVTELKAIRMMAKELDKKAKESTLKAEKLRKTVEEHSATFEALHKQLKEKAENEAQNYKIAAQTAQIIYTDLNQATKNYFSNKNARTYRTFKDKCHEIIQEHHSVLEKHRGVKNILCNFGAAVLGLGVFYLMAASYNYYQTKGKHFFFQFNTNSINQIERFENAVVLAAPRV